MSVKLAIVNYGMGNLHSVVRKMSGLDVHTVIASTANEIRDADKIILPGVGHFAKAMENLRQLGLYEALNEAVIVKKKAILGICLGMQLMAKESEEGNSAGLGWIDARVVRFNIKDTIRYKVPQTGWNTINICKKTSLLQKVEDNSEFYFLHSYHYSNTLREDALTTTVFQYEYVSAVEKENIFGTQFHPEKSHRQGMQLLKNFIQI